jgi:hypothetical protein
MLSAPLLAAIRSPTQLQRLKNCRKRCAPHSCLQHSASPTPVEPCFLAVAMRDSLPFICTNNCICQFLESMLIISLLVAASALAIMILPFACRSASPSAAPVVHCTTWA